MFKQHFKSAVDKAGLEPAFPRSQVLAFYQLNYISKKGTASYAITNSAY